MRKRLLTLGVGLLIHLLSGCASTTQEAVEQIAKTHVPDPRTEVFDVKFEGSKARLVGVTTSPSALAALKQLPVRSDAVILLPDKAALNGKTQGIVSTPVATLYKEPRYTSAVQTQAVLGTPVDILRGTNWLQVRLPEGYIAWMPREQVSAMTPERFKACADLLMVTANEAVLRAAPSQDAPRLMLLSAGSRLLKSDHTVSGWTGAKLPDARLGYLRNADIATVRSCLSHWEALRGDPTRYAKALSSLAQSLLGQSYLWAGTSSFGMDCSGFVQTVFLRTGLVFPRDTDQQARVGARLDSLPCVGDLLFFGEKSSDGSERISHVALSLGGMRFIHCRGYVRIASLNAADPEYDAYEKGRFLFAIRPNLASLPRISPTYKIQAEVAQIH